MNYEEMSDFEVNKAVGLILGLEVDEHKQDTYVTMSAQFEVSDAAIFFNDDDWHDYCNNPSDAWPIIVDNEITIAKHVSNDEWEAYGGGYEVNYDHEIESCRKSEFMDKNPLRAAMICFLKMKDAEN